MHGRQGGGGEPQRRSIEGRHGRPGGGGKVSHSEGEGVSRKCKRQSVSRSASQPHGQQARSQAHKLTFRQGLLKHVREEQADDGNHGGALDQVHDDICPGQG